MAGTGVGKYSTTAGNNTDTQTVNFSEGMAPSNVNNAARETMANIRSMYNQIGEGFYEFGDGDGTYTVARSDSDTITITASSTDLTATYYAGRAIRITDSAGNVTEGTIVSSAFSNPTNTINVSQTIAGTGTPLKIELGIQGSSSELVVDGDNDTKIQVEEGSDDDTIRFDTGGTERLQVSSAGAFALQSAGGSFIHSNTISNTFTLTSQNMFMVGPVSVTGVITVGSNSTVVVI